MNTSATMRRLLLISFIIAGSGGFHWTSDLPDDAPRYICVGDDLYLPWNVVLGNGEEISRIGWYSQNDFGERLIANFVHNQFVSMVYGERLKFNGTAGLVLKSILPADKGVYSVELSVHTGSSSVTTQRRSVHVFVGEPPTVVGGRIRALQEAVAIYSEERLEYEVQLTCGQFIRLGEPPVSVVWNTPQGSMESTGFENGYFHLALRNPIRGGTYTFSLPASNTATVCLSSASQMLMSAQLPLNLTKALITLQQAPTVDVLEQNDRLRDQITQLRQKVPANSATYVRNLEHTVRQLQHQVCSSDGHGSGSTPASAHSTTRPSVVSGPDPCLVGSHRVLNGFTRDVSNQLLTQDCDDTLQAGWYSFQYNGSDLAIPRTCPTNNFNKCGSQAGYWLDAQPSDLPLVGQEVELRACASYLVDCCYANWEVRVRVRNCGAFMVYYLVPAPNCRTRYCVERT